MKPTFIYIWRQAADKDFPREAFYPFHSALWAGRAARGGVHVRHGLVQAAIVKQVVLFCEAKGRFTWKDEKVHINYHAFS